MQIAHQFKRNSKNVCVKQNFVKWFKNVKEKKSARKCKSCKRMSALPQAVSFSFFKEKEWWESQGINPYLLFTLAKSWSSQSISYYLHGLLELDKYISI